jgi:arsenate reductase (glutaredoxin)
MPKKIKVYEYAACSTCKKALKFLDQQNVAYEKIPIAEKPPSLSELKAMLKFKGGDIRKLFNTSGIMYREMKLSEKLPNMSESEAIQLLSKNGKLVKRPFLLTQETGCVGFNEAEWKKALT